MSRVSIRPGISLGTYPERTDIDSNWFEQTVEKLVTNVKTSVTPQMPRLHRFIKRVNKHAEVLKTLGQKNIAEQLVIVRSKLLREGFIEDNLALSFALIREMAEQTLNMRPYDVQLMGGWIMINGMLAEMETGEGKTLTAALPASTAALAGAPVHVITSNDYLAQRDANLIRPLYEALGLSVGIIQDGMETEDRRAAYACDITYCTNKQIAFDYLRDRLAMGNKSSQLRHKLGQLHSENDAQGPLLLRGLCFAIVDEADAVLVDDARTPLILAKDRSNPEQEQTYQQALTLAAQLNLNDDFLVRFREREIELTEAGQDRLAELSKQLSGVWTGARRREEMVEMALSARYLYTRDKHYLVKDNKVQIIDENTGRAMADRSWENGLHQMIECKEHCPVTGEREVMASLTYQRFFRRYLRLSGMSGTAQELAAELQTVYRLNVMTVPPRKPCQRFVLRDRVYRTLEAKWHAVITRVRDLHRMGRPVLIGTRTLADSELLSTILATNKLPHRVLNARQDQQEAEIIAQSGESGRITVATNMAGRGTDIHLAKGIAELGGLHVIATERNDARRIDRQLFGRCARQGDPGSCEAILCLEDALATQHYPKSLLQWLAGKRQNLRPLPYWLGYNLIRFAQKLTEKEHQRTRHNLFNQDEQLGKMLSFSGRQE